MVWIWGGGASQRLRHSWLKKLERGCGSRLGETTGEEETEWFDKGPRSNHWDRRCQLQAQTCNLTAPSVGNWQPDRESCLLEATEVYLLMTYFLIFKFYVSITPRGLWDRSSLTRAQTHTPGIGSTES